MSDACVLTVSVCVCLILPDEHKYIIKQEPNIIYFNPGAYPGFSKGEARAEELVLNYSLNQ